MAAPRTTRQKEVPRHLLVYAGLTPFLVVAALPLYCIVITPFQQEPDLYRMENIPFWFNMAPTLKNFNILFYQTNYGSWIVNTMTIATWVAIITLLTAVPAGYALARLRLPGAENIGIAIFMTNLVPGIILFLPLSRVVAILGLQDSWWALVLVYPSFTVPFCTWLDRKSTRLNSSHSQISYAVFCLKKKKHDGNRLSHTSIILLHTIIS